MQIVQKETIRINLHPTANGILEERPPIERIRHQHRAQEFQVGEAYLERKSVSPIRFDQQVHIQILTQFSYHRQHHLLFEMHPHLLGYHTSLGSTNPR